MKLLKEKIARLLSEADDIVRENEEDFPSDEYDPYEWSGGNIDDAYGLGYEHGVDDGKAEAYFKVMQIIEECE